MKKVVILGANPAWQRTLSFTEFRPGEVNRAQSVKCFASGKGINFSRASRVADKVAPLLLQFAGGPTGMDLERELNAEGIQHHTIRTQAATRCCTSCLCRKSQSLTELIDPSETPSPQEVEAFSEALELELRAASALAITGTLPGELPPDLYVKGLTCARERQIPVLLDAWKNVAGVLSVGGRIILKINAEELQLLTGMDDVPTAMRQVFSTNRLEGLGITAGKDAAYFLTPEGRLYCYTLPKLATVVSPLGCGDTVSAVFLSEYLTGMRSEEAFAAGLAAATANCLNDFCGSFDLNDAKKFRKEIRIQEIKD